MRPPERRCNIIHPKQPSPLQKVWSCCIPVERSCRATRMWSPLANTGTPRLERHMVDDQKAVAEYREAAVRRQESTCQEYFFNTNVPKTHLPSEEAEHLPLESRTSTRQRRRICASRTPPGPTPLCGPGSVPGCWADVCGILKPAESDRYWKVRLHGGFSIQHEALGLLLTLQSCHPETFLHLVFVDWQDGQSHREKYNRRILLRTFCALPLRPAVKAHQRH